MSSAFKGKGLKFNLAAIGAAPSPVQQPTAEPVTGVMRTYGIAQDLHALRAQVEQLEKERGAQLLDPKTIQPSRWANRHADSFTGPEFEAFKAEIADAGGNVQPIKVRPAAEGEGGRYELVFGHRRHRACLALGLPVLAIVQETDERGLWVEMERENRGRADLSPWEQGMMYRRALDAGLFPSLRMLAQAIGVNPATVSKALTIADLPAPVVAAFPRPGDIQHRWASELRAALERDEAAVLAAANMEHGMPAARVFAALVAAGVAPGNTAQVPNNGVALGNTPPARLDLGRGRHVEVRTNGARAVLEFDAALLPPGGWEALEKALRKITKGS